MHNYSNEIETFGNEIFIECGNGKVLNKELKKKDVIVQREIAYEDIKKIEFVKPYETGSFKDRVKVWLTNFSSKGGYLKNYIKITYFVGQDEAIGGYIWI